MHEGSNTKFIVDKGVRNAIERRLRDFKNNPKEAFKNLDKNPIWLNPDKQIAIKSVRCYTGIKPDTIAAIKVIDKSWGVEYFKYFKTANNHHIAIYKDANERLHEHLVTFWHAVERKKYGIPIIIKDPKQLWDEILAKRDLPLDFLQQLPDENWHYFTSMQRNESFVFNMTREDLLEALDEDNYAQINPNIFRVRKISKNIYWFNHQYEISPRDSIVDKQLGRCVMKSLKTMDGIKIKVDILGKVFLDHPD